MTNKVPQSVRRFLVSCTLLATALASAQAGVITNIVSGANGSVGTTLDAAGTTPAINIPPNTAWDPAAPQWVSTTYETGNTSLNDFVVLPNGTHSFYQSFNLPGNQLLNASLMVWADDTAAVYLNNSLIFAASTGPFPRCSDVAIGCLPDTKGVFGMSDLSPYLNVGGNNQFRFDVVQGNLVSYGLAYTGSFETSQVPEPVSLILVGAGLMGLGLLSRRRNDAA